METGDRRTEEPGGAPLSEENVIRLPREWVGPLEELVPIGPGARARAAQREAESGMPTAADAFWSEDSAALHDAVQAPPGPARGRLDPPTGLVPPIAGLKPARLPRLLRLPRLRSFSPGHRAGPLSRRWRVLAVPAAALVALVVVMIGISQNPASHRASSRTGSPGATAPARAIASSGAAADGARASLLKSEAHRRHRTVGGRARTKTHPRANARRAPSARHRATPTHHAIASPTRAVTETAATPATSHPSAPVSTPTTSSASTASTGGSVGSKPAPAPAGPVGFGSKTGGCNPKCS